MQIKNTGESVIVSAYGVQILPGKIVELSEEDANSSGIRQLLADGVLSEEAQKQSRKK